MDVTQVGLAPDTSSAVASAKLAENFDTFLQLLTAQLQNQDPLSPMESNEFVSQLVQFSEVEQAISTNQSLETLIDLQTTNQATAALNYIGSVVEAAGDYAPLENGRAEFSYTLDETADSTLLVVKNELGQVVYSTPGERTTGKHNFVWNGVDSNGNQSPDGTYEISATTRDAEGALTSLATTGYGRVTGVESSAVGTLLNLGNIRIPVGNVLSIQQAETTTG